jgi:hypothetical protein
MSTFPGYEGPAHPLSTPIEALTAVCTAPYNHRAAGIRNCENAFHLASMILGGRDIIKEFTAARIWPISYGWAPTEIVNFNVNWAAQEVPFPRFGLQLGDGQSADNFMLKIERRVNLMIGEYTMNEYKTYKNLVKHKKRINRVFSEICGDKSFCSRRPGRKMKMPAVAVASCSAVPLKAPRRKSLKGARLNIDETTSSSVQPVKTKSLESTKRKRKFSEQVLDVELEAASGLAQMSRKKSKKAVKKIVAAEVRRVPLVFDDDIFAEPSQKGFSSWPFLRFNFHEQRTPGSENEFVDVDSFSDVVPEVRKEIDTAAAVNDVIEVAEARPSTEASSDFARELELTIHKGEDPVQDVFLIETCEDLPEGQDPSHSIAAFNKSFGTSHRGELLSVGCEVADIGDGKSKILTLWKSPTLIHETGEGTSEQILQSLEQTVCDFGKEPCSSSKKTPGKTSVSLDKGSVKKVIVKDLSKKGSLLLLVLFPLNLTIFLLCLCFVIF